jgi:SAM-dependent methyltransferase
MLKCASDFWVKGNEISIDLTDKGFADLLIKGEKLSNLKFGLAKVGQGHALAQQNRQGHTLAQQNRQRHAITQQNRQGHALALPFDENSQDLIVNSFLIDRVENPKQGLEEMYQILKPNGKLIVVTPLNFQKAEHWQTYFPPIQIKNILTKIGFEILDWQEEIMIDEPLDFRGNSVCWKCLGLVAAKI